MTTQELKQYIDKVLGNSIRCLLPSYWWKRLFNQVADRVDEVEQSTSKLIESKVEEVKMPIVESVDELEKLELAKGGVAAVEKVGEPVVVNLEDCYLSADAATDWDKYTVIRGFSEKGAPSNAVGQIHLFSDKSMENGLTIACGEGKYFYYKIVNGRRYDSSLEEVNKYLASGEYRLVFGYYIENVSAYVTLYSAFPQPSLYIKGDSWERLAKESDLEGIEGGNSIIVLDNGTTQKNADAFKKILHAYENDLGVLVLYKEDAVGAFVKQFYTTRRISYANDKIYLNLTKDNDSSDKIYQYKLTADGKLSYNSSWNETTIDEALSDTSTNAVQNKAVKAYVDEKVANIGGTTIREFYIGDSLTDEQKAWNLETAMMVEEKKCTTIFKITAPIDVLPAGTTIPLSAFVDRTFLYVCSIGVNAAYVSITIDSNGNSDITVEPVSADAAMSSTSTNAVQNKVITAALGNKADKSDIKTINGVSLLGGGNIVVDVDTSNLATKEELTEAINTKQDKIDDLEAIRSGAALGATALQEHQDISHLATKEEVIANEEVTAAALNDLNDKLVELAENVQGETVTKEEFETAVNNLNDSLSGKADAQTTSEALTALSGQVETLSGLVETAVTSEQLSSAVDSVNNTILENEEITAAALVDLNTKISDILERLNNAGL